MSKLKRSTNGGSAGSRKGKTMDCRYCGSTVDNVDENTIAATCWMCVAQLCSGVPAHKLKLKPE